MEMGFVRRALHRGIQLCSREGSAQAIYHGSRPIVLKALLPQLVQEDVLRKCRLRIDFRGQGHRRNFVDLDGMISVDYSGAELNGRNMALANGAEAQDKAQVCSVKVR